MDEFIEEGSAKILRKEDTFFNPAQKLNRDLTIAVVKAYFKDRTGVKILMAMAASGLRGIRYLNEMEQARVYFNDYSSDAIASIVENLKLNGYENIENHISYESKPKITVTEKDCNVLMHEIPRYFDVIDIDPFGSCAQFAGAAFKAIKHNGLICFTCTDKAALCSKVAKCYLKYGTSIKQNFCKNEMPIRVLLSFLSREAAKYDCSIVPVLSFSVDFYLRVIVRVVRGKAKCCIESNSHALICNCQNITEVRLKPGLSVGKDTICCVCSSKQKLFGPFWNGALNDKGLIREVLNDVEEEGNERMVGILRYLEQELDQMFYYEMPLLSSFLKVNSMKIKEILSALASQGFEVSLTHCDTNSFKTNAPLSEIIKMFESPEEPKDQNLKVEAIFSTNFHKKLLSSGMKPGSLPSRNSKKPGDDD